MNNSGEGLSFESFMPVSFQVVDNFPEDEQLMFINERNESLLRTSLIPQEAVELEGQDEVAIELRRQDLKINLLMDMVAELLVSQNGLPPAVKLLLNSTGLEFTTTSEDFKPGQKVEIDLYITASIPRALKFFAEVANNGENGKTVMRFVGLNQVVQDWLEKIIFRHHRRMIAQGIATR